MLFFTSDTHFNDPRILRIDRRPFASLAEHDKVLVGFWNETVGEEDGCGISATSPGWARRPSRRSFQISTGART
jgi:hypothetical protein